MDDVLRSLAGVDTRRLAVVEPMPIPVGGGVYCDHVKGLITQSMLLHLVSSQPHLLGPMRDISLGALGLGTTAPLLAIPDTSTARAALETLVANNLWGAPVVTGTGVLAASLRCGGGVCVCVLAGCGSRCSGAPLPGHLEPCFLHARALR
jgi:hypothetical protein